MSHEDLKDSNEKEVPKAFSLIASLLAFVPLILKGITPTYYLPIFSILAIIIFLIVAYKKLTNVITFAIILFLLSVVFPLLHFGLYRINNDNYIFEDNFLARKAKSIVEKSANHMAMHNLTEILALEDSILNTDIKKIDQEKIYLVDDFLIRIESVMLPGELQKYIVLYDAKGNSLGRVPVTENTMKNSFLSEQHFLQQVSEDAKKPAKQVFANDFWIESITAFSFGNIKTNSNAAIAIRAIQYLAVFVFFAMLTNTLRSMDTFVMKRRT